VTGVFGITTIYVGRRHIGILMRRTGIKVPAPQPGTSKAAPCSKIYPYFLTTVPSGVSASGKTLSHADKVWFDATIK